MSRAVFLGLLLMPCSASAEAPPVRFDHLRELTTHLISEGQLSPLSRDAVVADAAGRRWLDLGGVRHRVLPDGKRPMKHPMAIVAVYAERDPATGAYRHVQARGANNLGEAPEGIACVDDVARAAVLLLRYHQLTGDRSVLPTARAYLELVAWMQEPDGRFFNFVYSDFTVNRSGATSKLGFGWWAARAVWALGLGSRVFRDLDASFAGQLAEHVERTFPLFDRALKRYGQFEVVTGASGTRRRVPAWLIDGGGDLTAVFVLGLAHLYARAPSKRVAGYLRKLSEAVAAFQYGDFASAPYGAHMPWAGDPESWHGWGSRQMQALALAGETLKAPRLVDSARRAADGWATQLLIVGVPYQVHVAGAGAAPERRGRKFEQIAYAQGAQISGLVALARATGDDRYARYAGLLATWFFGNNAAGQPMYGLEKGVGFDGLILRADGTVRRNSNAGAESTIEAGLAVLDAWSHPAARGVMRLSERSPGRVRTRDGKERALAPAELLYPIPADVVLEMRVFAAPGGGRSVRVVRDVQRRRTVIEGL